MTAICRYCELAGAHGGVEECLAALHAAIAAEPKNRARPPPVPPIRQTLSVVLRHFLPCGVVVVAFRAPTQAGVWRWLAKRPARCHGRYWIESASARVPVRLPTRTIRVQRLPTK